LRVSRGDRLGSIKRPISCAPTSRSLAMDSLPTGCSRGAAVAAVDTLVDGMSVTPVRVRNRSGDTARRAGRPSSILRASRTLLEVALRVAVARLQRLHAHGLVALEAVPIPQVIQDRAPRPAGPAQRLHPPDEILADVAVPPDARPPPLNGECNIR